MKGKQILIGTVIAGLALIGAVPSHAAPVTWALSGVTLSDGGSVTGSFVTDGLSLVSFDITAQFGSTPFPNPPGNPVHFADYMGASGSYYWGSPGGSPAQIYLSTNYTGAYWFSELAIFIPNVVLDPNPFTYTLGIQLDTSTNAWDAGYFYSSGPNSPSGAMVSIIGLGTGGPAGQIQTAGLPPTPTPLPSALLLLAPGVAGLGVMRRKFTK